MKSHVPVAHTVLVFSHQGAVGSGVININSPPSAPLSVQLLAERIALTRTRTILIAASLLWLGHVGVVVFLGGNGPGPLLSDCIQFALGGVLMFSIIQAEHRSEGMAISFWRLTAVAYALLIAAQALSVYNDFFHKTTISWMNNLQ